jgi:hypothetical protein
MLGLLGGRHGKPDAGLDQMRSTFELVNGYAFYAGYPAVALAETLLRTGRAAEALPVATKALNSLQSPERGLFAAELWRQKGEAAWQSARDDQTAEHCLRSAIRVADAQSAKVFHLRSSLSLARMLAERGRGSEAREVLAQGRREPLSEWIGSEASEAQELAARLGR